MSAQTTDQPVAPTPAAPLQDATAAPTGWHTIPRVNLLPVEIMQARSFRRVQQLLAVGVGSTVLAAGLATWWAETEVGKAEEALAAVQQETARLEQDKARYAEVPRILAQVEAAETVREHAMSVDVPWYRYLNDLALATPPQVWLTELSMSVQPPGGAGSGTGTGDPLSPTGIGGLSFKAESDRFPDVAAWLDALVGIPGLDASSLRQAARGQVEAGAQAPPVQFDGDAVIGSGALSHSPRYNRRAS